jgi:hypothetical protein
MFTTVWNPHRFSLASVLPKGQKYTSQCYVDKILPEICTRHDEKAQRKSLVHAENAQPHTEKIIKQYLEDHNLRTTAHPCDSPDLTPRDCVVFGHVKRSLKGAEFQNPDECLDAVVQIVIDISLDTLTATFHQ